MALAHTRFDYSVVTPQIAEVLQDHAARIRERNVEVRKTIIEIGQYLRAAKRCLPHGRFEQWVADECNFTVRTAQMYMNAADFWLDNHEIVKLIPPSAVYAVAAPGLSYAVREKVVSAILNEDCRSLKAVQGRIKQERSFERALDCLHDQAWTQAQDAMREVITILIKHLPPEQVDRVNELLDMIDDVHFRRLSDELRKRRNGD